MFKVYERGANHVWEYIFEEYQEERYKLYGIDSNDYDYIRELERDDPDYLQSERENFATEYAKLTDIEKSYIQGRIDALLMAMELCRKVANKKEKY